MDASNKPNTQLRQHRKLRGFSQKKLGELIGVDQNAISRWERGERDTSPYYQEKLCLLFGKPADELGFFEAAPPKNTSLSPGNEVLPLLAQAFSQGILTAMSEIREGQDMDKLRRQFMELAVSLASTTMFGLPTIASSIAVEDFLNQSAASIKGCWHLMKGKGLPVVEEIISANVPTLMGLTLRPSAYQQTAASLATQAKILQAVLAMHRVNFVGREVYCKEAVQCSRLSGEKNLEAAALMYLAYTYTYCLPRRPQKAVTLYLEALHALGDETSLVRSDIYMGLSDAYAQCKEEQKALEAIEDAKVHFPAHPEHDPSFLYADCGWSELYQWEGKMYLDLAQHYPDRGYYQKALTVFSQSSALQSVAERSKSETSIHQADAARGLGDLDLYATCLKDGTLMALSLGSQKRYSEAWDIFQRTPQKWLHERQIQELAQDIFKQPGRKLG